MTAEPKTAFDPRRRRPPAERPGVGAPPDPDLISTPLPSRTPLAVVGAPVVAEPAIAIEPVTSAATDEEKAAGERSVPPAPAGSEDRLPGLERSVGSRQIHTTLSAAACAPLETARAEHPGTSYGELIINALRAGRPTLIAERPPTDDDPLARPPRSRRLLVEGRARSRQFTATTSQAAAIPQLAEEAGIPNLSELVERAVLITYGTPKRSTGCSLIHVAAAWRGLQVAIMRLRLRLISVMRLMPTRLTRWTLCRTRPDVGSRESTRIA